MDDGFRDAFGTAQTRVFLILMSRHHLLSIFLARTRVCPCRVSRVGRLNRQFLRLQNRCYCFYQNHSNLQFNQNQIRNCRFRDLRGTPPSRVYISILPRKAIIQARDASTSTIHHLYHQIESHIWTKVPSPKLPFNYSSLPWFPPKTYKVLVMLWKSNTWQRTGVHDIPPIRREDPCAKTVGAKKRAWSEKMKLGYAWAMQK